MDAARTFRIRPLPPGDEPAIALVAERMRLTLVEVLGEERGASMYSTEWLRDRVRWHLDPSCCTGQVLLAEDNGRVLGHTIVRVEAEDAGQMLGLFSTTYVEPASRRSGVADALIESGEAWIAERGMTRAVTDTSRTNAPLIYLFEKHGYTIVLSVPELQMVRLAKVLR